MPLPANTCDAMQIVAAEKLRPLSRNLISPLHGLLAMSCKVLCSKVRQHAGCPGPCNARRRYGSSRCRAPPRASRESAALQIEVLLPVDPSTCSTSGTGTRWGEGLPPRRSTRSILAELFVALPPTPHMPITDADDLGSLRHQVIFLAKACKITFCAFIARSTAAFE